MRSALDLQGSRGCELLFRQARVGSGQIRPEFGAVEPLMRKRTIGELRGFDALMRRDENREEEEGRASEGRRGGDESREKMRAIQSADE